MAGIPPSHISLRYRRALSGKLQWLVAAESLRDDIIMAGARRVLHSLSDRVDELARRTIENESPSGRLDAYLHRLHAELDRELSCLTSKATAAVLGQLKDALRAGATGVDCESCARQAGGYVCDGTPDRDDATVSSRGDCVRQIFVLWRYACETTHRYCEQYSLDFASLPHPDLQFFTIDRNDSFPHDLPIKIAAGAMTRYAKDPFISRITLVLNIEAFDGPSYFSALYILFHELIVQAYQGLALGEDRSGAHSTEWFSEGWMDLVAYEACVSELDIRAVLDPASRYSREFKKYAQLVHEARVNCDKGGSPLAVQRLAGRCGARRFWAFLKRYEASEGKARDTFMRISFALNVAAADPLRRDKWIYALASAIDEDGTVPEHAKLIALVAMMKKLEGSQYVVGALADPFELLEAFADLKTASNFG